MPFPPSSDWHLRPAAEVLQAQQTDAARGLSAEEAARRLQEHGTNELATQQARPWPKLLLDQFTDFMILVLLAAAVVSGLLGEWVDTLVIVVIVVLNAVIGFTQARRADQAIAALRQLAAAQAQVLRGGQPQPVPAADLVPGDIVLLEAGNQIPADLRLLEAAQLKVDESTLTGESVTVEKRTEALVGDKLALGDRINLGFKGTTVTHGRARGVVVATDMGTELGTVAGLLNDAMDRGTPLQLRLARFSKQLSLIVLLICAALFGFGQLRGEPAMVMLLTAISLAVAAIPEALPAVVTVLLAVGARRMADFNALIRRLSAVETLGSVSVICADKTGTLTQNRMHAELALAAGQPWHPAAAEAEQTAPSAAAPLFGLPMPLLPIHILWVNLVTDGLPGVALAAEPAERGIMRRPPRVPQESLFAHGMGWQILLGGGLLAALCLGLQHWAIGTGDTHWQTMVFTVLTLGQMALGLAIRSDTDSLFTLGLMSNKPLLGAVLLTFALQMATIYVPWLNPIFKTQPLAAWELGLCVALAALVFVAVELEKAWRRQRMRAGARPA